MAQTRLVAIGVLPMNQAVRGSLVQNGGRFFELLFRFVFVGRGADVFYRGAKPGAKGTISFPLFERSLDALFT